MGAGGMVTWSPYEDINIFYGEGAGSKFSSSNATPSDEISFTGKITAFTGSNDSGTPLSFWGVYPYDSGNRGLGDAVTAYLPTEQVAVAGSFANRALLSVAESPGLTLSFKNVCSLLSFTVTHPGIQSVTFSGANGEEVVAGRVKVSMSGGIPEWESLPEGGSSSITLNAPSGETLTVGATYYIALLPQTFSNGFKVVFVTEDQVGVRTVAPSGKTFTRATPISYTAIDNNDKTTWTDRPLPNSIVISPSEWMGEVGESVVLKVYVSGPDDYVFDPDKFFLWGKDDEDPAGLELPSGPLSWVQVGDTWQTTLRLNATSTALNQLLRFCYGCTEEEMMVAFFEEGAFQPDLLSAYAQIPVDILGHGEEIEFADPVTAAICLENYDRNGDGVLTVNEAAAVTTLLVNGVSPFCRPDDSSPRITTFDELRYFTGLTEIGEKAFYRQFSLSSVLLPDQITAIGSQAFAYSGITSIEIPESVETIGSSAFSLCNHLGQITIPASVRVIEGRAFFSCPLASVSFGEESNLTTIGDLAFAYVYGTSSIVIPDSVTSFGEGVFKNARIGHVRLPSSMKILPANTFSCSKVYEIEHDNWDQITDIGDNAFSGDYYTSVRVLRTLPAGLKTIGNRAFRYTVLPDGFTLPSGVTSIGDEAFSYSGLTKVELPATLSSIGYGAFSNCALEKVYVKRAAPATISQKGSGVLAETFGTLPALNGTILVPYDKEATYKSSWATWADYIQNNYASIPGGGNIGDDGDFGDGGDA